MSSKQRKPKYSARNDMRGIIDVRNSKYVVANAKSKYASYFQKSKVQTKRSTNNHKARRNIKQHTYLARNGEECGCDGGLVSLTLKYIGGLDQDIIVIGELTGDTFFDGIVSPNDEFTAAGTNGAGGRMDNSLRIFYDNDQEPTVEIHISCSEPLYIGQIFGEFQIVEGISRVDNKPLCEENECPIGSFPDCFGICNGPGILDCAGNCYDPNRGPPQVLKDCAGVCDGTSTLDCNGVCGGTWELDCGGNCYDPRTPPLVSYDCNGVCGGTSVPDCHGVCDGTAVLDCNGVCGGDATYDCNGVCNGTSHVDCKGVCGGNATFDCAGNCYDPDDEEPEVVRDCKGECGGNHYLDCGGNCISDDCFEARGPRGGKKFVPVVQFGNRNKFGSINVPNPIIVRTTKKSMFIGKNM